MFGIIPIHSFHFFFFSPFVACICEHNSGMAIQIHSSFSISILLCTLTFDLISQVQLCLTSFEFCSVNACVDHSLNCRYILILQMAVVQFLLFFSTGMNGLQLPLLINDVWAWTACSCLSCRILDKSVQLLKRSRHKWKCCKTCKILDSMLKTTES